MSHFSLDRTSSSHLWNTKVYLSGYYLKEKQLVPWDRALLEKLIDAQLVKKLPLRFITVFTRACHESLS
jgi:hypothetical protein